MQVQIVNGSSSNNIFIKLVKPLINTVEPPDSSIPPKGSIKLSSSSGTSKLYVWDSNKSIIWKGAIPTFIKNSLIIFPEHKRVEYDNVPLPNMLNSSVETYSSPKSKSSMFIWIIIFIVLVIIICVWLFLKSSKQ